MLNPIINLSFKTKKVRICDESYILRRNLAALAWKRIWMKKVTKRIIFLIVCIFQLLIKSWLILTKMLIDNVIPIENDNPTNHEGMSENPTTVRQVFH